MKENATVSKMVSEIVKICSPFQVFMVSFKTNSRGELSSFKLCIVVDDCYEDIKKLEADIQMNTDCPVPCDVIIYRVSEWNECVEDDCTFAYRVENAGEVLYEQM
ncbi:MAG: hypothetical protein FWG90_04685 [Oscillospiraceae bacterium]|nr:hypothetical protein [Oscillospiraceae bacterium]